MQPYLSSSSSPQSSLLGLFGSLAARWAAPAAPPASLNAGPQPLPASSDAGDAGSPALYLSPDITNLLGLDAADAPPAFAPVRTRREAALPAAGNSSRAVATAGPAFPAYFTTDERELVDHYTRIWHSYAIRRLRQPDATMQRWVDAVAALMRKGGVPGHRIVRMRDIFKAMHDASELLTHELKVAQRRLVDLDADTAGLLCDADVTAEAVSIHLRRSAEKYLSILKHQVRHTASVYTLVPRAGLLFETALRAAQAEARAGAASASTAGTTPALITTTTATTPSTTPATTTLPTPPSTAASAAPTAAPATAPTVVPGTYNGQAFPRIDNQQQALEALQQFARENRERLPQWNGSLQDLRNLIAGDIDFKDIRDVAIAHPCAIAVQETFGFVGDIERNYLEPPHVLYVGEYPRPVLFTDAFRSIHLPSLPYLAGRSALVKFEPNNTNRVVVSPDSMQLISTNIYTDATVERAKQEMWYLIFMRARIEEMRRRSPDAIQRAREMLADAARRPMVSLSRNRHRQHERDREHERDRARNQNRNRDQ